VKEIHAWRIVKDEPELLTEWTGYNECTWEPIRNFPSNNEILVVRNYYYY
jgi:hypothetical protein